MRALRIAGQANKPQKALLVAPSAIPFFEPTLITNILKP